MVAGFPTGTGRPVNIAADQFQGILAEATVLPCIDILPELLKGRAVVKDVETNKDAGCFSDIFVDLKFFTDFLEEVKREPNKKDRNLGLYRVSQSTLLIIWRMI